MNIWKQWIPIIGVYFAHTAQGKDYDNGVIVNHFHSSAIYQAVCTCAVIFYAMYTLIA